MSHHALLMPSSPSPVHERLQALRVCRRDPGAYNYLPVCPGHPLHAY